MHENAYHCPCGHGLFELRPTALYRFHAVERTVEKPRGPGIWGCEACGTTAPFAVPLARYVSAAPLWRDAAQIAEMTEVRG